MPLSDKMRFHPELKILLYNLTKIASVFIIYMQRISCHGILDTVLTSLLSVVTAFIIYYYLAAVTFSLMYGKWHC